MNNILIFIFFIAVFAKVFMLYNMKKFSKEKYINIHQRINTWFIIIFIVFIASFSKINMLILFSIISFLACREFIKLTGISISFQLNFFIILNIFLYYLSIYFKSLSIFLFSLIFVLIFYFKFKENKIIFIALLVNIYMLGAINIIENLYLLVVLLVLIEINDIFQYISGNLFGNIKITPKISPNKTLEGLLGGIILTTISSIFIKIFFERNIILYTVPILALLGFLGDISISYFKRKYNKKDSGTLLKGHGGILDRVDSLIINSVFLAFIYLGS